MSLDKKLEQEAISAVKAYAESILPNGKKHSVNITFHCTYYKKGFASGWFRTEMDGIANGVWMLTTIPEEQK